MPAEGLNRMHSATVHHDKVPQGGARKKAQARAAYAGGMAHHEPRPAPRAVLLQAAIRVRYLLESWFFLKPLLASRQEDGFASMHT